MESNQAFPLSKRHKEILQVQALLQAIDDLSISERLCSELLDLQFNVPQVACLYKLFMKSRDEAIEPSTSIPLPTNDNDDKDAIMMKNSILDLLGFEIPFTTCVELLQFQEKCGRSRGNRVTVGRELYSLFQSDLSRMEEIAKEKEVEMEGISQEAHSPGTMDDVTMDDAANGTRASTNTSRKSVPSRSTAVRELQQRRVSGQDEVEESAEEESAQEMDIDEGDYYSKGSSSTAAATKPTSTRAQKKRTRDDSGTAIDNRRENSSSNNKSKGSSKSSSRNKTSNLSGKPVPSSSSKRIEKSPERTEPNEEDSEEMVSRKKQSLAKVKELKNLTNEAQIKKGPFKEAIKGLTPEKLKDMVIDISFDRDRMKKVVKLLNEWDKEIQLLFYSLFFMEESNKVNLNWLKRFSFALNVSPGVVKYLLQKLVNKGLLLDSGGWGGTEKFYCLNVDFIECLKLDFPKGMGLDPRIQKNLILSAIKLPSKNLDAKGIEAAVMKHWVIYSGHVSAKTISRHCSEALLRQILIKLVQWLSSSKGFSSLDQAKEYVLETFEDGLTTEQRNVGFTTRYSYSFDRLIGQPGIIDIYFDDPNDTWIRLYPYLTSSTTPEIPNDIQGLSGDCTASWVQNLKTLKEIQPHQNSVKAQKLQVVGSMFLLAKWLGLLSLEDSSFIRSMLLGLPIDKLEIRSFILRGLKMVLKATGTDTRSPSDCTTWVSSALSKLYIQRKNYLNSSSRLPPIYKMVDQVAEKGDLESNENELLSVKQELEKLKMELMADNSGEIICWDLTKERMERDKLKKEAREQQIKLLKLGKGN